MKLTALKELKINGIQIPELVQIPPFADKTFASRVFGAFCRINPELPCMTDKTFIANVAKVLLAVGSKEIFSKEPAVVKALPNVAKWRKWYADEKEKKAQFRKDHKDEIKAKNDKMKELYGWAKTGEKETEPIASWVVEPEGFYFGRGASPLNGLWKEAVKPEHVTVNTNSKVLPVLINSDGSTESYTWDTMWNPDGHFAAQYDVKVGIPNKDGIVEKPKAKKYKMIQFAAASSVKKEGQTKKYEASEDLASVSDKLNNTLLESFKTGKNINEAIAVYLMMHKGIRIGGAEATENGTKGLLALVWNKDVKRVNDTLKFSFLGKDSVKDNSVLEVPKNILDKIESIWSKSNTLKTDRTRIKDYVATVAPGVPFSPKLLRTLVAAIVMKDALKKVTTKYKLTSLSSEALKKLAFDEANMEVAKQLNHQRGVNKAAEAKREAKFEENETKLKEREVKVKEQIKAKKDKIKKLSENTKLSAKEKAEKKAALKKAIAKAESKLETASKKLTFQKSTSSFTGTTSKAAYIDPKIVSEWCRKINLPLEKVYTKAQLLQFADRV